MKIYDSFMFYDELDLLSLRIEEHDPFVDFFVIVQANKTFTGKPKNKISIKDRIEFKKYSSKIIEIDVDLKENPSSAWENEEIQRNAQLNSLSFSNDDIIYLSDLDEIVSRKYWSYLIQRAQNENIIGVWQRMFYYSVNLEIKDEFWALPKIGRAQALVKSGLSASYLRVMPGCIKTPFPCGWHFSYLMTPKEIKNKISSFSHQEFNLPEFNQMESIASAIREKKDLFGRNKHFQVVPVDESWPLMVQKDKKWNPFIFPHNLRDRVSNDLFKIKTKIKHSRLKNAISSNLNRFSLRSERDSSEKEFDKKTFNDLLLSRPKTFKSDEWRRLIECLNSLVPLLPGNLSARQCAELFLQIQKNVGSEGVILELGSQNGQSSVFASRAAMISNSELYCVGAWNTRNNGELDPRVQDFTRNISLYGCNNVHLIREDSDTLASKGREGLIDFIFVNSSNDPSVLSKLDLYKSYVKSGGVICGSDWDWLQNLSLFGNPPKNQASAGPLWMHKITDRSV